MMLGIGSSPSSREDDPATKDFQIPMFTYNPAYLCFIRPRRPPNVRSDFVADQELNRGGRLRLAPRWPPRLIFRTLAGILV